MKKILYFSLLLGITLSFTSCKDDEDLLFNDSAAERLNQIKSVYSQRLWASPNGWAMQYYPTYENEAPYGTGYLMLCDFNEDYSVRVAISTYNSFTQKNEYKEDVSAWEIITDNGPVLSFNSYNSVLHTFSDPEDIPSTTDETETGRGYEGDYEFVIVDAPEDASHMMLKGKKRGTYSLLTPMEEGVDYEEYLTDIREFHNLMFATDSPTFDVIYFGDNRYKLEDANDGIPNIYPYDGDAILDESFNPFLITKRGDDYYLRFRDEFKVNENETVQDFRYDKEKDIFVSVDNPEYYMDGDSPLRFYKETIDEKSGSWEIINENSDAYTQAYASLVSDFKNFGATLQSASICWAKDKDDTEYVYGLDLKYRMGKTTSHAIYKLNPTVDGDVLKFEYDGALKSGENILNRIPETKNFIDFICRQYNVTASKTKFNQNTLRFTSVSEPDMWFVIKFTKVEDISTGKI